MQQSGSARGAGSLSLHINPKTVPRPAIPGKAAGFEYDWMVTFWATKPAYCFPRLDVWLDGNLRREDLRIPKYVQLNDVANLRKLVLTTEVPVEKLDCWQMLPGLEPNLDVPLLKKCYEGSRPAKEGAPFRKWYLQCYEDLSTVKPGMTRREIAQRVWGDGGITIDTCECENFVHPACPALKIRIGFDVKHDEQNRPIRSQDDIMVYVSVPFVEEFFCD
jgi:hypothetical protein